VHANKRGVLSPQVKLSCFFPPHFSFSLYLATQCSILFPARQPGWRVCGVPPSPPPAAHGPFPCAVKIWSCGLPNSVHLHRSWPTAPSFPLRSILLSCGVLFGKSNPGVETFLCVGRRVELPPPALIPLSPSLSRAAVCLDFTPSC
jgi:hypothetical protein